MGRKRERQPGGLSHSLCRAARLRGRAAGAGLVHAATPDMEEQTAQYADGIALQAEPLAEKPQLHRTGRERQLPCPHHRLQQKLSESLRRAMHRDTGGVLAAMTVGDRQRSFGAAAQRLPGCGPFPCAGGQRDARLHSVRGYPRVVSALRSGSRAIAAADGGGVTKPAGAAADGRDRLYTFCLPRRCGGMGQRTGCVGVWPPDAFTSLAAAGILMTAATAMLCAISALNFRLRLWWARWQAELASAACTPCRRYASSGKCKKPSEQRPGTQCPKRPARDGVHLRLCFGGDLSGAGAAGPERQHLCGGPAQRCCGWSAHDASGPWHGLCGLVPWLARCIGCCPQAAAA